MRSRPRSPVLRTSGSRATAAALTRPGMPGRCPLSLRTSRARCRSTTRARAPGGCWRSTSTRAAQAATFTMVLSSTTMSCTPTRAAEVRAQAEALAGLVARCGGQVLADVSPSGGRHVFVLFAAALPWLELRDVARALALRFPSIDTAPMSASAARSALPAARHKCGGWRVLSTPVDIALAAVEHPNGPEVWAALLAELAAELRQVETGTARADSAAAAELDDTGVPWVPRLGGRAPLGAELEQVARTGRWDRSRHAGRSEARIAVLNAAAARGWQLADVRSAIASGAWKGLAGLYERRSEPGRMERLLPLRVAKSDRLRERGGKCAWMAH